MSNDAKTRFASWRALLANKKTQTLFKSLEESSPVEVAEFLAGQNLDIALYIFLDLTPQTQASLLEHMDSDLQMKIYQSVPKATFAKVLEYMSSDLRADFYLFLSESEQVKLLPYLSKNVRKNVLTLSTYSPERAGGIMSTDFVAADHQITTEAALEHIREAAPSKKMLYFLYIVDDAMTLKGVVDLKDLILAPKDMKVKHIANENIVSVNVNDDREIVANTIDKYGLMALPVLNNEGQLLGIVNYEDAIDVIREEDTEDMEKFMGIVPNEHRETYMETSSRRHFKQRIGWIAGLLVFGILNSILMHSYEDTIEKWKFLAFFISMISDVGGNVGSQSATMVIRALSLGQLSLKSWSTIIWKEMKVAFMISFCLFFLGVLKVYGLLWYYGNPLTCGKEIAIALTIAAAVSLQVISATLIGAGLPLLIKRLGKDPALAASPAITSIVDVTGMAIYLGLVTYIFPFFLNAIT